MIERLTSLIGFIITFVKLVVNWLAMLYHFIIVIASTLGFALDYLYLIPTFLLIFGELYVLIYIVNRLLNGRN